MSGFVVGGRKMFNGRLFWVYKYFQNYQEMRGYLSIHDGWSITRDLVRRDEGESFNDKSEFANRISIKIRDSRGLPSFRDFCPRVQFLFAMRF